jgi:hypothetical protein
LVVLRLNVVCEQPGDQYEKTLESTSKVNTILSAQHRTPRIFSMFFKIPELATSRVSNHERPNCNGIEMRIVTAKT